MSLFDLQDLGKKCTLLLAHGAGESAHSEFLSAIKANVSNQTIDVLRFNFPYMEKMLETGKRRPPDKMPLLLSYYTEVIESLDVSCLWIGGKSMGGRVASMLSHLPSVTGVVALGYPFHPPKKPESLRTEHLYSTHKPIHIFQGERDPFGVPDEIKNYKLPQNIHLHWVTDGDHSFKPRKRSGVTLKENLSTVSEKIRSILLASDESKID
ncbi:MAG: alpha/beta hydrolase [Gammaproteobacteria bacterium]|nr:alpha/beta hydrolase [Gammaproteobacteria bacterium]